MIRYLSILTMSLVISTSTFSQDNRFEAAKKHMREFKNGMLLVRLKTRDAAIGALEARGRSEEAEEIKEEQYEENKEAILAFSQVFDFAPVYFFYSKDSQEISEGNLAGNIFDKEMNPITNVEGLSQYYFIGEFGETEELGIDGFVLMDSDLEPLKAPFPFYSRKHMFFSLITLSKGKMVERLNEKLHTTYKLWFPEGEE